VPVNSRNFRLATAQAGNSIVVCRQDSFGMGQKFVAHLSWFNRFPIAHEQGVAQPLFEPFDLPTNGRLGQMQARCCPSKAPGLYDRS
jgi:hypothetical protein